MFFIYFKIHFLAILHLKLSTVCPEFIEELLAQLFIEIHATYEKGLFTKVAKVSNKR